MKTVEYAGKNYTVVDDWHRIFLSVNTSFQKQYYVGKECISCTLPQLLLVFYLSCYRGHKENPLNLIEGVPLSTQWDKNWVQYIAMNFGIPNVTEDHYRIALFVRKFYIKNGFAPMIRIIAEGTNISITRLFRLFPACGFGLAVCGMAGLPNTKGCV